MFGSGTKKWFIKKNKRQRTKGRKPVTRRRKKWVAKVLKQNREMILKELDVNKVLPYLVYDKVFSLGEYKEILGQDSSRRRAELFLDHLSQKGPCAFNAFCSVLEEVCPHLLTCFLLDWDDGSAGGNKKQGQTKPALSQENALSKGQEDTVCFSPMYTDPLFDTRVFPKHDKDKYGPAVYYPKIHAFLPTPETVSLLDESEGSGHGKPSLRRIKGRIHRSKSLDSIDLLDSNSAAMEETVIWEQHTVTLHRAPGFGFGIAISGGRDNPHFQSGETSIVISDVLKGGPAEGLLQENDRVVMVNAVSMDNVDHAYAVQQLRKSGKNAKITIRRKRKVQIPMGRTGERETMSEHDEDDDSYEEEIYEARSGRSAYSGGGATGRRSGRGERLGGRRDRDRERSGSRERSLSPRSDRHSVSSNLPPRPAKVTLIKSRKNEDSRPLLMEPAGSGCLALKDEKQTEYGLRLASHIFVKDISPESLAARDGNIQEGDVVLKINGTVTENLSLIDAKKLIERSKGKLKMVVQRDERATLLNIPDMDDSIPSANASDRDDISDIHSVASDHSNRSHERKRSSRSRSPDRRSEPSDHSRHSPPQISNGRAAGPTTQRTRPVHRSRDEDRISKAGPLPLPAKMVEEMPKEQSAAREEKQLPPLPEPKPVYAQPGQPDVDLPVSPADAPVPSVTNDDSILRPSMKLVKFKKGESVGLRLAGGNDVGIFVAGVLEDSPAAKEGLEEGDQILRVNNVDFANIIREEAVLFLLDLPKGEEVTILAQKKKDVYRRIVESDVGDSFYIRTHFEYEKESPYGLSFNKGEVFRVVDTLYNGKLGSWLAIRIGKNHQEVERGIIPNKNRAEQLSSVQYTLPKTPGGDRADFWRFRGLRSSKRNLRKSREDLSAQPVQTKFPAYERVVLREAGFLRPVVIFGPIADVAREKLSREEADLFELAKSEPRDAGTDQRSSGIIRLHTIKQIIDRDKHAVLDITPNAVDRLNYAQWYPIVVFLNPDSKQGVKNMRTRLCSESRKSARKLYERALKLRKNNHHLFTTTINLNNMNDGWYGALKETIQQQQNQLVWVSEGKADGAPDDDLDIHDDRLSYLSAPGSEYSMYSTDSRHTSDYEDTDTEGGAYTDQELDETMNDEVGLPSEPAITRSSEPVREDPPVIQDAAGYPSYQHAVPQPEPVNRIDPAGFKMAAPQQQAEAQASPPPPSAVAAASPAVEPSTPLAGTNPEEPPGTPQADSLNSPVPVPDPQPEPELAQPPTHDPHQLLPPGPDPKMYKKDLYSIDEPVRVNHGVKPPPPQQQPLGPPTSLSYSHQPVYQDQQPYRQYDHPPYGYDGGGYAQPKPHNYDPHLHYDNRVPHYNEQWPPYDQQTSPQPPPAPCYPQGHQPPPAPLGYEPRSPYEDGPTRDFSPPQSQYDGMPQMSYDNRPRHSKPAPVRYEEPPPPPASYDARSPFEPEPHGFPGNAHRSPDPPKQYYGDSAMRPSYNPGLPNRAYKAPQHEPVMNSEPPAPPPKPEAVLSPGEPPHPAASKPLPPPPRDRDDDDDDPAMKPQSVLNRVKMFENKRSVSVDRAKDTADVAGIRPTDLPKPVSTPGPVLKANSLSNLEQEKPSYRAPEPQKPQTRVGNDVVRSNHYDPDEDEEYYRKQLSYFDRRSFDNKPMGQPNTGVNRFHEPPKTPQPIAYPFARTESVEKVSPVDKRYEPVPPANPSPAPYSQPTPAAPPTALPKLSNTEVNSLPDPHSSPKAKPDLSALRAPTRDDPIQTNYLPPKSSINGTDAPPKTLGVPTSYNRYVPKPYTSTARPFERKFESPKFNHNLLPNDTQSKPSVNNNLKPQISPQPQDTDSGVDTFTRTMDNRPKYQHNNINAIPKAIPVSPSALEDDEEDEGHTVVATARGIFNCNGGVLSSIETGVSIIIPQGAIPDSVEQEIYFKVCRDNSILPPLDKEKGETLLSPLVMCGPHGLKFLKPVELRLPHCDPKCWQNKCLPGDPNYLVGANCVSVLIDHF
ncbi:tight junction protein ZO-1 isoform X6 [Rhinichthys klamathensis goyatoka]|uniref:tight junction protein ZO-1 isoform X6 n=1 Tax=Rhinichthys klamathensis goyatoka TaxID=3034132 RepID=UPI0024B4FF2E|nr:tight junction protein ZO-1 isoform X6 [Rhinichthys klamathensis goyatoka]